MNQKKINASPASEVTGAIPQQAPACAAHPQRCDDEKNGGDNPKWNNGAETEDSCDAFPKTTSAIGVLVDILTQSKDGMDPLHGDWKDVFLQALARAPIVTAAATAAGVSRRRALQERDADSGFARLWDDAMAQGIDEVEAAAFVSAIYGDKCPVFHQGKRIGWTIEYSTPMRAMLLKAWRPEVFKDKDAPETDAAKVMTLDEFRARVKQSKAP